MHRVLRAMNMHDPVLSKMVYQEPYIFCKVETLCRVEALFTCYASIANHCM
jgi:hypothetical protein